MILGGKNEHPTLFGRYIQSGYNTKEAVKFIKKTYELAETRFIAWTREDLAMLPLSDTLEIIAKRFFLGDLTAICAAALPREKFNKDNALRHILNEQIRDFRELIETIAVGTGLMSVI